MVGFSLQNVSGAAEGTGYVTFGQVFAKGAVMPGTPMIAKINGVDVPVQMDVKTLNADGSIGHAILTLKAPALSAGGSIDGVLAKASSGSTGTAIQAQDLISHGLNLKVEVNVNGTVKTIDAATLLQQAINNGTVETWLKGSQASEFRVQTNIAPNLDVKLDIRMDAAGKFHTDVIFARDDAYTTNTGTLTYSAKIIQDGQTVFNDGSISQYAYSTWHHEVSSAGSINPHVVYDMQYLINTGALPTYDLTTDVSSSAIDSTLSALNGADTGPLGNALVNMNMPNTGGRADIGPETMWTATYVTSQDADALKIMLANADASGSVPWHLIDSNGDPVRVDLHPNLWIDYRGTVDRYGSDSLPNGYSTESDWNVDTAHQPSLTYVPYLISGSHYYLDELSAQTAYTIAAFDPNYRDYGSGLLPDFAAEVRMIAWTLRSVGNAAYITPDGDPMKDYFNQILDNQLQHLIDVYVNSNSLMGDQGELEGWIWGDYRTTNAIPPWQQDYIATALGTLVQHGYEKADVLLTWMDNFLSGRFINEDNGFNPLHGATYDLVVINPSTGKPYTTWAEAYQATFGSDNPTSMDPSSYPDWAGGYAANAKASLAAVISATQSGNSIEAYGWLQSQTTEMVPSYESDPTWNLAPMLAEDKYLTQDEIRVHTGTNGVTMTAAASVEQMLIGNVGNDTIVGGSGINMLFGMDGNDTVTAGSGKTYLYGGDGNDRLIDGAGSNYFKGDSGADVFSFTTANSGDDVIADFTKGTDRIEIKSNLNGSGITTAAQVVATATASADGAVLHFGSHDIVLQGVMLNQLTPDIFTIV